MSAPRLAATEQRILAAFAEVMAPGVGPLPAAESEVPVASNAAELVEHLPARYVRLLRLAIRAFDRVPFPHRFSRLDAERRSAVVERLGRSRIAPLRELVMLLKTLTSISYARDARVQEVCGYRLACSVEGDGPPDPGPLGDLAPDPAGEECDVIVVGSGAGGAVTAALLAEAGLEVLVLEAGPAFSRSEYPSDPVEALIRMYRDAGLTLAEGRPPILVPIGRLVGGTTVINSGTCFRAPERVLAGWRSDSGLRWATELDPEYEEAEKVLAVARPALEQIGRNGRLVAEGARAIGARGEPLLRNAGGCVQCSSCFAGCRLDAKRGMHVSYLPRAVAAGARIRSGVEARRIIVERGRAVGVECSAGSVPAGELTVRARRAVVVSAGAFGTPELLLRSGLDHPAIGRNLRIQPATGVGARFADPVNGWEGIMQSYAVDEWERMGLMLEATFTPLAMGAQWLPGFGEEHQRALLDYGHMATNGIQLKDDVSVGRVRLGRDARMRIGYRLAASDARRLTYGIARAAEIWFGAGAERVFPPIAGITELAPGDVRRLEERPPPAHALRLEAFHPMGTAAMGIDPGRTAVDVDGALREMRDLYVADASLLPTALGVNPMMTIIAVCARNARALAERLT